MMTSTIMHNHISLVLNNEDSNKQQYSIATKIRRIVLLTWLGRRLLDCTAHNCFRTIIVIPDTKKVVHERTLICWQRVMFLKMLCFTNVCRRNATLTNVVICNDLSKDLVFNARKFQLENNENSLKAYKLKHSYYNMTEQGSRRYNSNLKHHDMTRYNSCLARRRAVKPTTLTSQDHSVGSTSFYFLLSAT
jgi:hypothetical protein